MAANAQTLAAQQAWLNQTARNAIKAKAIKRCYQIFSGTFVPANTPQITVNPQNVGLLRGFYVQVTLNVTNGSAVAINLSDFGPANSIAQFQFQDLQNNSRIQCPGWAVAFNNTVRTPPLPFGAAILHTTGMDAPTNYGNIFAGQISAPSSIAAAGTGTVIMWYYVPIAYSDVDLRGAIWANVVNATMQLNIAFPGNGGTSQYGVSLCAPNGADSTQAVFVGAGAGAVTAVTMTSVGINVYQVFYDQIPVLPTAMNGFPAGTLLLPVTDLATIYELKQTVQSSVQPNQDFNYQYSNFRDFLATFVVYINNGSTGQRTGGTDMNYLQLLSANFTAIWKKSPALVALETREKVLCDFPPGVYYLNYRSRPISTTQYGNMQLTINPNVAAAGAYALYAVEDFALIQTLSVAGSLAAS
jgi:hypothetical protein